MIESLIIKNNELPSEITITPHNKDFPPKMDEPDITLGQWKEVVIEKRMGFLE